MGNAAKIGLNSRVFDRLGCVSLPFVGEHSFVFAFFALGFALFCISPSKVGAMILKIW